MTLDCAFCLFVSTDVTRRPSDARTVVDGYAVCLDHATMIVEVQGGTTGMARLITAARRRRAMS